MKEKELNIADSVLQLLLKNAEIGGIRCGPILQILFDSESSNEFPIKGQVYLNLSSRWTLFESRPSLFPESEDEMPEMTTQQEIQTISSIRERIIVQVELGENAPHLVLTLDNGKIIFVNGKNDQYESWNVGNAFCEIADAWQVIACPGGEVAIFTPTDLNYLAFRKQSEFGNQFTIPQKVAESDKENSLG